MLKIIIESGPQAPKPPKTPFLKKVQRLVTRLRSDADSKKEWEYAKCLYRKLRDCPKLPPEGKEALMLLEPEIQRGAQSDPVDGGNLIIGDRMRRWLGED